MINVGKLVLVLYNYHYLLLEVTLYHLTFSRENFCRLPITSNFMEHSCGCIVYLQNKSHGSFDS